jgi:ribokinase
VGADLFGERAIQGFEAEGIDTRFVLRDASAPSGVALILVDDAGRNLISVAPGANDRLSKADVERARTAIDRAGVLLLQLEVPLETVRHAAQLGRAAGARVILDPAPARELDAELLADLSILTPNETEAECLTGIAVDDPDSAHRAATRLRERGVPTVLITLGARGCYLLSDGLHELIPAPAVAAVDSTAAGDTFNGALACSLVAGAELREAVLDATRAAAISVTRRGAQPSMPRREELTDQAS